MTQPTTSILVHDTTSPASIEIPKGCIVHHEVELGVVIGSGGRDISKDAAMDHVAGYVLALDMTASMYVCVCGVFVGASVFRMNHIDNMTIGNIQQEAKNAGKPWTVSKGYDTFCPVSDQFFDKEMISDPYNLELWLQVNGEELSCTVCIIRGLYRCIYHCWLWSC